MSLHISQTEIHNFTLKTIYFSVDPGNPSLKSWNGLNCQIHRS